MVPIKGEEVPGVKTENAQVLKKRPLKEMFLEIDISINETLDNINK